MEVSTNTRTDVLSLLKDEGLGADYEPFTTFDVQMGLHAHGKTADPETVASALVELAEDLLIHRPDDCAFGWWRRYNPMSDDDLKKLAVQQSTGHLSEPMIAAIERMIEAHMTNPDGIKWARYYGQTNTRDALVRRGVLKEQVRHHERGTYTTVVAAGRFGTVLTLRRAARVTS